MLGGFEPVLGFYGFGFRDRVYGLGDLRGWDGIERGLRASAEAMGPRDMSNMLICAIV